MFGAVEDGQCQDLFNFLDAIAVGGTLFIDLISVAATASKWNPHC